MKRSSTYGNSGCNLAINIDFENDAIGFCDIEDQEDLIWFPAGSAVSLMQEVINDYADAVEAGDIGPDDDDEPEFIWEDFEGYRVKVLRQEGNIVYYQPLGKKEIWELSDPKFVEKYRRMKNPKYPKKPSARKN